MHRSLTNLIAIALLLPACAATAAPAPASLTVLATADFHGALEAEEVYLSGKRKIRIGGPAVLARYMEILRRETKGPVVYLDAGDLFQGSMASNLFEGEPAMRFMNYLKPDAAALGNHEFDYGPVGPKAVPREPGDDPRGALKARVQQANFPVLAVNVVDETGRRPDWLKGSIVKETGGLRVGIIGAADERTPFTTNSRNLVGLRFENPVEPIRREAERLRREEGVSAVVVTMHVGAGCDDNRLDHQDDLSSCKIDDVLKVVKQLPEGLVDVVVSGHTHRGVAKRIGRTVILQPFSHGKYVGAATVPLNPKGTPRVATMAPVCTEVVDSPQGPSCDPFVVRDSTAPIKPATFLGQAITPDAKVDELLRPEMEKVATIKEQPLGDKSTVSDTFFRAYDQESALGNLMADVAREMIPGVDLGLANAGGVRANLYPGQLKYGSVFNVMPFDNQLAVMEVNGRTLLKMAELGVDGKGGIYLWSSNFKLDLNGCRVARATIDGKAVEPGKTYKIATNDFLAGNNQTRLKLSDDQVTIYWDATYLTRDLAANVFRRWNKTLSPGDYYQAGEPRYTGIGQCKGSR